MLIAGNWKMNLKYEDIINFKNIIDSTSRKPPFGIAQIGKAFRNEITPRNFIFRVREFEQMELEYFVEPGEDEKWHKIWIDERLKWWEDQGVSKNNIKLLNVEKDELAIALAAGRFASMKLARLTGEESTKKFLNKCIKTTLN